MKPVFIKLFIIFSTIIASLVLCECILRLFHPITPEYLKKAPYAFSCYEPGSYYWLRYKRNTTCLLHSNVGAFEDIAVILNSRGLRNPEIQIPKPANTTRILFVGDSLITGWGVSEKDSLPMLTGNLLRANVPSVGIETINAGLSASGQGYEYVFLKHESTLLDPDIIIVGLYVHNDIADATRESDWIGTDSDGLPTQIASSNSYVDSQGNVRRNTGSLKLKVPFLRTSYVYDLITDVILKIFPERFVNEGVIDLSCVYNPTCHLYDTQKNSMKTLFKGMHEMLARQKMNMIVVLIPSELQVHPQHSNLYGITTKLKDRDVQSPNEEFIQYFQQNGIEYLDLLPTFTDHASEPLYFTLDEHWTRRGIELAASEIAESLQKNGILSNEK